MCEYKTRSYIIFFMLQKTLWGSWYYFSYLTHEEIETHRFNHTTEVMQVDSYDMILDRPSLESMH
jgi:hypothetical protein